MKISKNKVILYLLFACVTIMSWRGEKKYSLSLTEPEVNTLLYVVDQSAAPHNQVKSVQDMLIKQLQPQVDTTQKQKVK